MAVVSTIARDLRTSARIKGGSPAFRNSGVWRFAFSIEELAELGPGRELAIFTASIRKGAISTTTEDWGRMGAVAAALGCPQQIAEHVANTSVRHRPDAVHRHLWVIAEGKPELPPKWILDLADTAPRIVGVDEHPPAKE